MSGIASTLMEQLALLTAPPTAFHFAVNVGLVPILDSSFQDVSGLDQTMETEAVREGGENRFVHQLPLGVKQGRLSLKRGVASVNSPLMLWCKETMEGGLTRRVVPLPVLVRLKGGSFLPLRVWLLDTAYPVRWEIEAFGSTKNELAIEHIELAYTTCTRLL
jgi:phage tail-like protein